MARFGAEGTSVRFAVRLTARGGRDDVEGWGRDGSGRPYLRARVSAPPLEGAANAALQRLLAHRLGCPPGAVRIVGGELARMKRLEVAGADEADLRRAFGDPP